MAVSAASDRRYYSSTIGNNYNYYSGAADVTEQVKQKRNGRYTVRGLTVDNNDPYCAVQGVVGGFSLLVIYSDTAQPFRLLNLYEGFQYMRYSGVTLNLSGFRVPNPLGTATGRVAHITWEGDGTLGSSGENLSFNGVELTDTMNPSGNQFNSKSSIDGDDLSYGIDFDAYTVGSPAIKPGDTSASTRYESGQDLVLLSAEIVALPNVPVADLSIEMTRNDELAFGKDVSYSITVSNKGPSTAEAPTVITNTLPAELQFVSAKGKFWSCTATGQEVKCTNTDTIASGASLPVLTITATVVARGTITNSALVTGKTFDPELANNTAVAKGVVAGESGFVFTDSACKDGFAFGHTSQTCTKTLAPVKAGVEADIFITAISGGVPTRLSASTATPVALRFAMSCHKPTKNAGVKARYAGIDLNLCTADGNEPSNWTPAPTISMPAGAASVGARFRYDDVGLVQLYLQTMDATIGTAVPFVSVPYEIRLMSKVGTVEKAFATSALDQSTPMFARAGDLFGMTVASYTAQGTVTPNFGAEGSAEFDMPAIERGAAAGSGAFTAMTELPALQGNFGAIVAGKAAGTQFHWDEVGVIKLTPKLKLETYLTIPVTTVPAYIGRFIPDHFVTSATRMDCVPNMKCDTDVTIAAYSKEPMTHGQGGCASGGRHGDEKLPGRLRTQGPAGGVWQSQGCIHPAHRPQRRYGRGGHIQGWHCRCEAGLHLDQRLRAHRAAGGMVATDHHLPAREREIAGDGVHSLSTSDPHEVGIRIVSGRLLVPNAHGSERLNLPLKVSAQYWTGTNWELSKNDKHNVIDPASPKVAFSNFTGGLSAAGMSLVPQALQGLTSGVASLSVKVSPAVSGSADLLIDHLPWLPSTKGRLKFGTYKSPLIYLREVH